MKNIYRNKFGIINKQYMMAKMIDQDIMKCNNLKREVADPYSLSQSKSQDLPRFKSKNQLHNISEQSKMFNGNFMI
jgi:hypothetical protein